MLGRFDIFGKHELIFDAILDAFDGRHEIFIFFIDANEIGVDFIGDKL